MQPSCSSQPSQFHCVMELLDQAVTPEQRNFLESKFVPVSNPIRYDQIAATVMDRLLELEGKPIEVGKGRKKKKRPGKNPEPSLSAIAKRIKGVKNAI